MAKLHFGTHWLVPSTLLFSFAAGIALALGHHYFYSTLHDQRVSEALLSQDTNNSIGTAFAFLVRAAFVIAISTAYWQLFWRRLCRPLPLSTIDDLASQLKAVYQLLNLKNLRASPTLTSLALLAWLIPLAVLFTPAALKVVPKSVPTQELIQMRVPDFNASSSFVASWLSGGGQMGKRNGQESPRPVYAGWAGPSSQVRRSLFGTAYQGQLPTFAAPAPNSSYSLEFGGPALQCGRVSNESGILADLVNAGVRCLNGSTGCHEGLNYYYLAWVPTWFDYYYRNNTAGIVPFRNGSISGGLPEASHLGTDFHRPQAIYMAYRDDTSTEDQASKGISMLNCTLYNATYAIAVEFQNGKQNINVTAVHMGTSTYISTPSVAGGSDSAVFSMTSRTVQSYLGYMQAIGELLVGSLYFDAIPMTNQTHVLETDLAYTNELYPIYENYTELKHASKKLRALKDVIEELAQNMTLSLLTVPELVAPLGNKTSVSMSLTYNAYHYNQRRLWSAYGAAIAATLLAVLIGVLNLAMTGASYSDKFSTIIRVSRDEALDVLIKDKDRLGQDPLPKYIGKANFQLDQSVLEEKIRPDSSSYESGRSVMSVHAKSGYAHNSLLRGEEH